MKRLLPLLCCLAAVLLPFTGKSAVPYLLLNPDGTLATENATFFDVNSTPLVDTLDQYFPTLASLSTVATTGAYSDLTGRPTLGTAAAADIGSGAGQVAAGDHGHAISEVTALQSTLDGKLDTGADLPAAQLAGTILDARLPATLDGKTLSGLATVAGATQWQTTDLGNVTGAFAIDLSVPKNSYRMAITGAATLSFTGTPAAGHYRPLRLLVQNTSGGGLTLTHPSARLTDGTTATSASVPNNSRTTILFRWENGEWNRDLDDGTPPDYAATIAVQEEDGTPSVPAANTTKFPNGSVTDNGDGSVSISFDPLAQVLTVEEADGTPQVTQVNKIVVSNGTLSNDGGGQVTVTTGGGGSGLPSSDRLGSVLAGDGAGDFAQIPIGLRPVTWGSTTNGNTTVLLATAAVQTDTTVDFDARVVGKDSYGGHLSHRWAASVSNEDGSLVMLTNLVSRLDAGTGDAWDSYVAINGTSWELWASGSSTNHVSWTGNVFPYLTLTNGTETASVSTLNNGLIAGYEFAFNANDSGPNALNLSPWDEPLNFESDGEDGALRIFYTSSSANSVATRGSTDPEFQITSGESLGVAFEFTTPATMPPPSSNAYLLGNHNQSSGADEWAVLIDTSGNLRFYAVSTGGTLFIATASSVTLAASTKYQGRAWFDNAGNQIGIRVNQGTKHTASFTSDGFVDRARAFRVGGTTTSAPNALVHHVAVWNRPITDVEETEYFTTGIPY